MKGYDDKCTVNYGDFGPYEWELSSEYCPCAISAWLAKEPDQSIDFSDNFEFWGGIWQLQVEAYN